MSLAFEQGPIRPPSESNSLLLRLTRNCSWNRCAFCRSYKNSKFSLRSAEEIKRDIDTVGEMHCRLEELSQKWGYGGRITRDVIARVAGLGDYQLYHVATWFFQGAKNVFFQDGNTLILKTRVLLDVLGYLKEKFPSVERVTSYARSDTIMHKSLPELQELKEAGFSRIHVGLESGSNEVLKYMDKGVTAEQHIEAGRRVREAGISLSEYVLLGLGGKRWFKEHSLDTAAVINAINPDFIRLRSLAVVKDTPLYQKKIQGEFCEQTDEEVVRSERLFIESLQNIQSQVVSDHSLNLLEEVNGRLPQDQQDMLRVIDRFLNLPEREKQIFVLGKRWGLYRRLDDLTDTERHAQIEEALGRLESEGLLDEVVSLLKDQGI